MNELLELLKQNALESPENLAKMLGLSVDAIKKQIDEYKNEGILRTYQAIMYAE